MKKIRHALSVSVLTCLFYAVTTPPALACGPSFVLPVFAMDARPEDYANFAKGNIGIIYPTFNRSALFASYRLMNNQPFSEKEQADLIRNWKAEYENTDTNEDSKNKAINNWIAARKKIAGKEPEPKIYADRNNPDSYSSFYNCTAGAFDNAVKTLDARLEKTKSDDANMKEWLHGQDQVFGNCSETKEIPSAVAADAPDWLKVDRDYQIAAAQFYATQYDEAKAGFEKISKNTASPWRDVSAYLLARVYIRQASAISENTEQHDKMLAYYKQAEDQLNSILADTSLSNVHGAAKQMLNLINFRIHPETLHASLAKKLTESGENPSLYQDLTDYRRLLDSAAILEDSTDEDKAAAQVNNNKYRQAGALTDWIFTIQSKDKTAYSHAVEKWQETKNNVWLVASLMKANTDSPEAGNLITASKAIDKTSAAFVTATYHTLRLLIAQGQIDEARKTLDALLLKDSATMTASAVNSLLSQRLTLAQDLNEFVKFSQRHAVIFAYDEDEYQLVDVSTTPKDSNEDYTKNERAWSKRTMFDADAARIMNTQIPLSVLKQIALHSNLPDYLRSSVALSAWVRAILLDEEKIALELAPELAKLIPELKNLIPDYNKAKAGKAKTFEAVYIMLKNPAMRPLVDQGTGRQATFGVIENFRDNWWCDTNEYALYDNDASRRSTDASFMPPTLLSKEQLAEAKQENDKINKLAASGSNYLANKTSEWAEFAPKEKRLPEALALAVRATRYGCQNCDTGRISKDAFDILKDRFGNTESKKKTPYWFKDEGCETTSK